MSTTAYPAEHRTRLGSDLGEPGSKPPHPRRADERDRAFAFLVGLRIPNRESAGAVGLDCEVFNVESCNFGNPEHGVAREREDDGITKPRKRAAFGECSRCVGLLPAKTSDLTSAPIAPLASETREDTRGGGAGGRGGACEFGAELYGGNELRSYRRRQAGVEKVRDVRCEVRVIEWPSGEPAVQTVEGSGVCASGVRAQ